MAFKFPWTNFHELNFDWMLKQWREIYDKIPTKVSQLINDRHYINRYEAPVQSVNGQTGNVHFEIAEFNIGDAGTLIVNPTSVAFTYDSATGIYKSGNDPISGNIFHTQAEDKIYKVLWDSSEYWCYGSTIAKLSSSGAGNYRVSTLGCVGIFGYDDPYDSDAPFCITKRWVQTQNNTIVIFTSETSGTHTIAIYEYPYSAVFPPDRYISPYVSYNGSPVFFIGSDGKGVNLGGGAKSANGEGSVSEGLCTTTSANGAHAEGVCTTASYIGAHAEGINNTASKSGAHVEGNMNNAAAAYCHVEGVQNASLSSGSHVQGKGNISDHVYQNVFGKFNAPDPSSNPSTTYGEYAEIVGNGADANNRSNARTLDWSGNEKLQGDITLGAGSIDETNLTAAELAALKQNALVACIPLDGDANNLNPVDDLDDFTTGISAFHNTAATPIAHFPWASGPDFALVIAGGDTAVGQYQIAYDSQNSRVPRMRVCGAGSWTAWDDVKANAYNPGDTFDSSTKYIVMNGYITGGTQDLFLDLTLPKSVDYVTSATVDSMVGTLRGVRGYLNSDANEIDIKASYNVTVNYLTGNHIRLDVSNTNGFTNVDNNTPVAVYAKIKVTFA